LVDTAGLGEAPDRIDALGQAMSRRYAEAADLVVYCEEDQRAGGPADGTLEYAGNGLSSIQPRPSVLRVRTKADLGRTAGDDLQVSAVTGEGLDALRRAVAERLFSSGAALADLEPALTRERHRVALARAAESLQEAAPHLAPRGDAILAAHHVQEAVRALDALIGAVDVEEVLDRLFSTFCVGK
jgi:tRNA modification GTPase